MTNRLHAPKSFCVEIGSFDTTETAAPIVSGRVVYLIRGLPSCGKSHRSQQLVGSTGVICEADQFFYTQVGQNSMDCTYDASRLQEARDWNFQRFILAIDQGVFRFVGRT